MKLTKHDENQIINDNQVMLNKEFVIDLIKHGKVDEKKSCESCKKLIRDFGKDTLSNRK